MGLVPANVRTIKTWSLIAALCFIAGLSLRFLPGPTTATNYLSGVLFIAFHLALLPVIAHLAAPAWVRASGYVWVIVDNVVNVMTINGVDDATTMAARLGIHIAAATWLIGCSIQNPNLATRFVGTLTGVWLAGYSLTAPWVSPAAFYPAGALLALWLFLIGFTTRPSLVAPAAQTAMA